MYVCVCGGGGRRARARVCVRACVRACVCVCVCVWEFTVIGIGLAPTRHDCYTNRIIKAKQISINFP